MILPLSKTVFAALLMLTAGPAFAQFNPYAPQQREQDSRAQRAARERCVARCGDESRGIVEFYGADAIAALQACSVPVAKRLSLFHTQGELAKVSRPRGLLACIGQTGHGNDVALWAMQPQHADILKDPDALEEYVSSPLDFALSLRSLTEAASARRANRLSGQSATTTSPEQPTPLKYTQRQPWETDPNIRSIFALLAVTAVLIGIALWWKKRQQAMA